MQNLWLPSNTSGTIKVWSLDCCSTRVASESWKHKTITTGKQTHCLSKYQVQYHQYVIMYIVECNMRQQQVRQANRERLWTWISSWFAPWTSHKELLTNVGLDLCIDASDVQSSILKRAELFLPQLLQSKTSAADIVAGIVSSHSMWFAWKWQQNAQKAMGIATRRTSWSAMCIIQRKCLNSAGPIKNKWPSTTA